MERVLTGVTALFDLLFHPLQWADPRYALLAVSALSGLAIVAAFRYTANGDEIRRVKDRLQAHLLALRLFADAPGVVLRAQGRLLRSTLAYLWLSLPPLLVMLVPMLALVGQVDLRLGWLPVRPGESVVLTGRVADPDALRRLSLHLPPGLTLAVPPVRSVLEQTVSWRIETERAGDFAVQVALDDRIVGKDLTVATHLARVSPLRVRGGLLERVLHPAEPPLPPDTPLEAIAVGYRRRVLDFGLFESEWLSPFLALSLLAGLVAKTALRVEI